MNHISGQVAQKGALVILLFTQMLIVGALSACSPSTIATTRVLQENRTTGRPGIYDKPIIPSGETHTRIASFRTRAVEQFIDEIGEGVVQARALIQTLQKVDVVRFAVIGDYGRDTAGEQRVAALVDNWNPDFVITTGDNNYPLGSASSIDVNIGKYYSRYIGNYKGVYGPGSEVNRFWPALGNHDWHNIHCYTQVCRGPYLDYFTLPGNERYYDIDQGLVHLFMLDGDSQEPDGHGSNSAQGIWLQDRLATSTSCFKVVVIHRPPYSSGDHGSAESMRWPFQEWGADVVMSGNDHSYERIDANGFPYFINGAGGAGLRGFPNTSLLPMGIVSIVRYNQNHGAMLVTATSSGILYQFFNTEGVMIDQLAIDKDCAIAPGSIFGNYLPLISGDPMQLISNMPGIR